jgi:predicted short-subunit dehydrogenase-like oxidoreductase (DUF2520 family)
MSLAVAAIEAGHSIAAVVGRTPAVVAAAADRLAAVPHDLTDALPASDLMLIAVRDDAIGTVASQLVAGDLATGAAAHLSGLAPVAALAPLHEQGLPVGSFHPLQTLPNPEAGAAVLAGSWFAVTTGDPGLRATLDDLAASLGARSFLLEDSLKATYHAAAAAAANFPLAALTMAQDLFAEAGVPFEASRPLVEAVVANAYEIGPRAALTGPVARGDVGTVAAQLEAVTAADPSLVPGFVDFVAELARLTGRSETFEAVIAHVSRGAD